MTLPHDLTAKVGKFKAMFGKDNTWHAHVRPWVDQPLVVHNFFGDEGCSNCVQFPIRLMRSRTSVWARLTVRRRRPSGETSYERPGVSMKSV